MEIGAILSRCEAEKIRKRLAAISRKAGDRRVLNLCRMIARDINKGGRRAGIYNEPKLF